MREKFKRTVPYLCAVLGLFAVFINCVYCLNDFRNQNAKVEQYCAKVNERNVQEYKGCIQLKPVEILDNLANNVKDLYDVVDLPEIKED